MVPKAKILVIDDDFLVLRAIVRVLDGRGYETTAVDSGVKAIELVKKEDFDLVMSDIRMPEMDGVETSGLWKNTIEITGSPVPLCLSQPTRMTLEPKKLLGQAGRD